MPRSPAAAAADPVPSPPDTLSLCRFDRCCRCCSCSTCRGDDEEDGRPASVRSWYGGGGRCCCARSPEPPLSLPAAAAAAAAAPSCSAVPAPWLTDRLRLMSPLPPLPSPPPPRDPLECCRRSLATLPPPPPPPRGEDAAPESMAASLALPRRWITLEETPVLPARPT